MSVLTIAVFSARSADIGRSAASVFMERSLDVSLRGRVESFLQNSAGVVGCCLGLGRWTAPTTREGGGTPSYGITLFRVAAGAAPRPDGETASSDGRCSPVRTPGSPPATHSRVTP